MNRLLSLFLIVSIAVGFTGASAPESGGGKINWYSWEEAVELNKTNPKKIFVDVYTDWCGWCKRMDQTTFKDEKVANYVNENFYAIKLDAEMKEKVVFNNHTFEFVNQGRRGVHTLAYSLLDGRMSYPSYVFLNEKFERIIVAPGFQATDDFIKVLKFSKEEHYNNKSWAEYSKGAK